MELETYPIAHAGVRRALHPGLATEVEGRSAVRYVRFLRPVELERIELPISTVGRGSPSVSIHPAHLRVSVLDPETQAWRTVADVEFPPNPKIGGEGLSAGMTQAQMEAHYGKLRHEGPPWVVPLDGLRTDHLRVECDREHPVWPSHGEMNGPPHQVPFGLLHPLRVIGRPLATEFPRRPHLPVLALGACLPEAPRGMSVRRVGEMVLFEGRKLSVGFGLRRPILLHLGWDAGADRSVACANRLMTRRVRFMDMNRSASGPLFVDLHGDCGSHQWTGEVEVRGNQVAYRNLRPAADLLLDAVFTVEPERLRLELTQRATADLPALEFETWRFGLSLSKGMTGVAGVPTLRPGRSGDVRLPALLTGDGNGCLAFRTLGGDIDAVRLQVESYQATHEVTAGIVLGNPPGPDQCLVVPGRTLQATVELAVTTMEPSAGVGRMKKAGPGLKRHWASSFSCYRPEWAGFSNHAASTNCHVNQHVPIDVAVFTARPKGGPDPFDMARFTVQRALLDGSGYGYWRNYYMDSDPILVSSAGRIHQARPDLDWLRTVRPGLLRAVQRMLGTIGDEGLAVCRDLSGDDGSFRWSSNAWDAVGFGHMDAYANAWTYRALRNASALLAALGDTALADRCRTAASRLKEAFVRHLVNPETGWVVGWKSRDGKLHDHAWLFTNGPACAFGVLEPAVARRALAGLEALRDTLGLQSARCGLPFNLIGLEPPEHTMTLQGWAYRGADRVEPSFELFTNGSMAPLAVAFYLRALSIHGFTDRARQLAADLDEGFAAGLFSGGAGKGMGEGNEFLSWDGLASGYEGTFGPNFGVLYGIAIEQGVLAPPTPEWWPDDDEGSNVLQSRKGDQP